MKSFLENIVSIAGELFEDFEDDKAELPRLLRFAKSRVYHVTPRVMLTLPSSLTNGFAERYQTCYPVTPG